MSCFGRRERRNSTTTSLFLLRPWQPFINTKLKSKSGLRERDSLFAGVWQKVDDCCAVTLCRWPAKQTIPLSVLARNQTKGFGIEISAWPEVVTGREKRVGWTKERQGVGDGTRTEAVDSGHPSREARQHEIGSSEEDRVKMSAFQLLCGIFASNPC